MSGRGGRARWALALAGVVVVSVLTAGAADAATPTVSLDRSVDLVSPSTVVVSWSGFTGGGTLHAVAICDGVEPPAAGCGIVGSVPATESGSLSVSLSAVFTDIGGVVHDCRSRDACVVAVTQFVPDFVTASAPVSFAGTPNIGTLTVDPTADLDDGDTVEVRLEGWSGSDTVRLEQCAGASGSCRPLGLVAAPSEHETVMVVVSRFLRGDGADVDCAFEVACDLRATSVVADAEMGSRLVGLEFLHRGPFTTDVSPAGPYTNGQAVQVSGSGLSRGLEYAVRQCLSFGLRCGPSAPVAPMVDGTFTMPFRLQEAIDGDSCRVIALPCSLIIEGSDGLHSQRRTHVLRFADVPFGAEPSAGLARYQPVRVRATVSGRVYTIEQCGPTGVCTRKAHGSAALGFVDVTVRVTQRVGPEWVADCVVVRCELQLRVDGRAVGAEPLDFATPPTSVSMRATIAYESDGVALVKTTLARSTNADVTVTFETADGSAAEPGDYVRTSAPIVIPAGERVGYGVVPLVVDDEAEAGEQFGVRIRAVSGAWIDQRRATVTIHDRRPPR